METPMAIEDFQGTNTYVPVRGILQWPSRRLGRAGKLGWRAAKTAATPWWRRGRRASPPPPRAGTRNAAAERSISGAVTRIQRLQSFFSPKKDRSPPTERQRELDEWRAFVRFKSPPAADRRRAGVAHCKQVRRRVERTPNRIRDAQRFRHRRFTAALANVTAADCNIVSNPTSPSHLDLCLRSHASISSGNPPPGSNRGLLLFPPPGSHRARSADRPVPQAPPPFCRDDRPGSGRCGEILPGAQ